VTATTGLGDKRMQLLQQLLAEELNASAFGSVPSGGTSTFATRPLQWLTPRSSIGRPSASSTSSCLVELC
jgi:hypothetical protein